MTDETDDATETYRVTVWYRAEINPDVEAASPEEAVEEAKDAARRQGATGIQQTNVVGQVTEDGQVVRDE